MSSTPPPAENNRHHHQHPAQMDAGAPANAHAVRSPPKRRRVDMSPSELPPNKRPRTYAPIDAPIDAPAANATPAPTPTTAPNPPTACAAMSDTPDEPTFRATSQTPTSTAISVLTPAQDDPEDAGQPATPAPLASYNLGAVDHASAHLSANDAAVPTASAQPAASPAYPAHAPQPASPQFAPDGLSPPPPFKHYATPESASPASPAPASPYVPAEGPASPALPYYAVLGPALPASQRPYPYPRATLTAAAVAPAPSDAVRDAHTPPTPAYLVRSPTSPRAPSTPVPHNHASAAGQTEAPAEYAGAGGNTQAAASASDRRPATGVPRTRKLGPLKSILKSRSRVPPPLWERPLPANFAEMSPGTISHLVALGRIHERSIQGVPSDTTHVIEPVSSESDAGSVVVRNESPPYVPFRSGMFDCIDDVDPRPINPNDSPYTQHARARDRSPGLYQSMYDTMYGYARPASVPSDGSQEAFAPLNPEEEVYGVEEGDEYAAEQWEEYDGDSPPHTPSWDGEDEAMAAEYDDYVPPPRSPPVIHPEDLELRGYMLNSFRVGNTGSMAWSTDLLVKVLTGEIERQCIGQRAEELMDPYGEPRFVPRDLRCFYSYNRQPFRLDVYLNHLIYYSNCSTSVLMVMLMYLERVQSKCKFLQLTDMNCHRLVLTALVLAIKYIEDEAYSNTHYAQMGGISVGELNELEWKMLRVMEWKVGISAKEYLAFEDNLVVKVRNMFPHPFLAGETLHGSGREASTSPLPPLPL